MLLSGRLHLVRTMEFLDSIGIQCRRQEGASGFLKGVRIVDGRIHVDCAAAVEDLLHEAGHLAVLPEPYRKFASDDLEGVQARMGKDLENDVCEVDSRLMRAIMQSGEAEATAWAWAAGLHLDLPPELIISDASYGGTGASMRTQLHLRGYLGINGLWHGDMCARPHQKDLPQYPTLLHWVQPIGFDAEDLVSPHRQFQRLTA